MNPVGLISNAQLTFPFTLKSITAWQQLVQLKQLYQTKYISSSMHKQLSSRVAAVGMTFNSNLQGFQYRQQLGSI